MHIADVITTSRSPSHVAPVDVDIDVGVADVDCVVSDVQMRGMDGIALLRC
jgi:CheY-like chemotaxis protein